MSRNLSTVEIQSFDAEVKHAYQDMGKIRGRVRERTRVVGKSHRFSVMGQGQATERVPQTDISPMNITYANRTANLTNWVAAEYTDIFDQSRTNIEERSELAKTIAMAIKRREDQLIIDALDASTPHHTVGNDVGGNDSNLNLAKLIRASRELGDAGVSDDDLTLIGSHFGKEALLGEEKVTSSDYGTVKALTNGELMSYMGFDFRWIASRQEGGLTKTGNDRTCYALAKSSTGLATGIDARMEINYVAQKTSWLCAEVYSAGSVVIDDDGVVEITARES